MNDKIVTIAGVAKEQGYATRQFGKNHLGDLNHLLPTNHGFDEFFGNLYHLNAEEEPEMDDYPSKRNFPNSWKHFGPRGVIHSWATDKDDPKEMPRWGKVGKQKIEDTGPLNEKRMETCDDEFVSAATDFIRRQRKRQTILCLAQYHPYALHHAYEEKKPGTGGPLAITLS